jgi:uncharacterized protein
MNGTNLIIRILILISLLGSASCSQISASWGDGVIPTPIDTNLSYSQTLKPESQAIIKNRPSTQQPLSSVTATDTPYLTPTATFTLTPTVTPTLHPIQILAQRQTLYPGGQIVIEDEIEPGANYRRFIASYLSEGLKIYALLTIPNGEMPVNGWPSIVFNHGYIPPEQYRTTERYIAYVDRLARSGYIVFRSDYRGHGNSEGVPTGAYGHPGYTADVLNAVGALKQFPQADPDRIGMWGHSMGGFLTLRAMVISQDIKAGVIWAGVVASYIDMFNRWRLVAGPTPTPNPDGPRRWRTAWIEDFGTFEENPSFWNSISANSYLLDLSGPIQLHHGTNDSSVPHEFSEVLYQQIQAVGKNGELYIYEGDDHNLSNNFTLAMNRTIEFFDQHLK